MKVNYNNNKINKIKKVIMKIRLKMKIIKVRTKLMMLINRLHKRIKI